MAAHTTPPPYAIACAGLSAFGALVAALAVSARQKQLRETFGCWRTAPGFIVLAVAAAHSLSKTNRLATAPA